MLEKIESTIVQRIEAAEMIFLRTVAGRYRVDEGRNEEMRQTVYINESEEEIQEHQ
jgi:hypothetical protein